jgi:protein TonB
VSTSAKPGKVSSNDRLSFTFIIAIAVHALLILGLSFEFLNAKTSPPSTIEVVLTKTKTDEEAEDPKVIAENNQIQSGRVDFESRPSAPTITQQSLHGEDKNTQEETRRKSIQVPPNEMIVHKQASVAMQVSQQDEEQITAEISNETDTDSEDQLARLLSELNEKEQQYAKRPRVNHVDTLSAKTAVEAKYIKEWVEKIEIIGNIHYPALARKRKISGSLIMSVLVNHNGDVVSSTVRQSSGEKIFDDVAKKVIQLSAPFKSFPDEMRKEYDQLMITRTWLYQSDQTFSTQ